MPGKRAARRSRAARATLGGVQISIRTTARDLARALGDLTAREIPFVSAVTLTRVAQRAASYQRSAMQRSFDVRSQRVLKGIRIRSASKRDWPNQSAQVGTLDEFIAQHELGGEKRPRKGAKRIAVPVRQVVPKGAGGGITRAKRPRALRQAGKVTEVEQALRGRKGRGKKAPLRAFYWLRPSVRLKPRLGMRSNVRHVLEREHDRIFAHELDRAMRKTAARAAAKAAELAAKAATR